MRTACAWFLLACLPGALKACPPLPDDVATTLSRDALLTRVAVCHPDVRAAARALAATQADRVTAAQSPNPQLTLGAGGVSHHLGSESVWSKTFDHQLRIDQLIERGDKPALRRAAADSMRDAARADLAEALRQARLASLRTYYDWIGALGKRTELTSTAALYEESLRAFERRLAAGDASPIDATRFRLEAVRLQADLAQAEADARTLRLQIATQIGAAAQLERLAPAPPVAAPTPPGEPFDPRRRPDVVAATARLTAAQSARALAQALKTRDLSVGLQLDRYPASVANPSGTGNTVSVLISVPLFVRHAYEGENARAEADVATAQEVLDKTLAAAQSDHERARALWEAAQFRRRLVVAELAPAAERVAAGAELAYRRGASSILDVLDARRALRTARIERIGADAELAKASAELEAATEPVEALILD